MRKEIRFAQSARKHKVGKVHALYVMAMYEPEILDEFPIRLSWVGNDAREREIEIIALDLGDSILVIHVMPAALRKRSHE